MRNEQKRFDFIIRWLLLEKFQKSDRDKIYILFEYKFQIKWNFIEFIEIFMNIKFIFYFKFIFFNLFYK